MPKLDYFSLAKLLAQKGVSQNAELKALLNTTDSILVTELSENRLNTA